MNSQFFEKIGVELPDGSPIVDATKLTKGQHYKAGLTQERLKELLSYDPETGIFRWKINIRRKPIGGIAGTVHITGYVAIKVGKALCYAHRLAFLYMIGRFPIKNVDHINRDRSDNRWENLRECTQTQNTGNAIPIR